MHNTRKKTGLEFCFSSRHELLVKEDFQRLKEQILKTDFADLAESDGPASACGISSQADDRTSLTESEIFLFEDEQQSNRLNKKPVAGKLTKMIMSQPFAQNWFFKSPESETSNPILGNEEREEKQKRELSLFAPQQF